MKKIWSVIFTVLLLSACSSKEEALINEQGYAQYEQTLYEDAIKTYTEGIAKFPEYSDFYTNRGMAYFEKGDTDKALEDLEYAISLNSIAPEAYANRGTVYLGIGDYQNALVDFYKAIDQKDSFETEQGLYYTYLNLGTLLNEVGEFDEALVVYELALEENDEDPSLYNAMGMLYTFQEDYPKAIEYFNLALDLDQDFGYAYGNRGNVYYQMGDYKIALSDANTALAIDPYIPQVYDLKAKIHVELEEYGLAQQIISQGVQIWTSYADLYITRANIFMYEEDYGQALINYGLAVRYGNDEGHKGQGVAYRLIGQYNDAMTSLETYLDDHSHDLTAQMEVGLSQQGLVLHHEAIITFEAILANAPESYDVMYYLALSYEYIENYDKAIELLKDVIQNDQSNIQAQEELEFINKHLK